jgi:hypothetical protein
MEENGSQYEKYLHDLNKDIKFYKNFSLLIYNLSEEYSKKYDSIIVSSRPQTQGKKSIYLRASRVITFLLRKAFHLFKKIIELVGIKELLKQTKIYRRLYICGTIDKLQGRD